MPDPKEKFLAAGVKHFADRGFYGASLADITADLGVTKQALLHHFGSKEKLYGEVLARISRRFEGIVAAADSAATAEDALVGVFGSLYADTVHRPAETQLLMRELLDNRRRAEKAAQWYLKPFLEGLVALGRRTQRWQDVADSEILAGMYQLLGAINYFAISEPTLTRMFGRDAFGDLRTAFPQELEALVRARLTLRVTPQT